MSKLNDFLLTLNSLDEKKDPETKDDEDKENGATSNARFNGWLEKIEAKIERKTAAQRAKIYKGFLHLILESALGYSSATDLRLIAVARKFWRSPLLLRGKDEDEE